MEGVSCPGGGDDEVKTLDTVTRAKATRGGGAEAQMTPGRGRSAQSARTVMPLTWSPRGLACSGGNELERVV